MTADTTTTPLMSLVVPVPAVRSGPAYASDIVTLLSLIDSHTHITGQGSKIPPGGLTLTADLDFNPTGGTTGQSATNLRSTRYLQLASAPATASDIRAAYSYGSPGDLYWKDGAGTEIQITSGGLLNSAALTNNSWTRSAFSTNITILSSDTPVYYDGDTSGAARTVTLPRCNAVAGKFYLFRQTTGTNGIVLAPNAADSIDGLSAGTSLTLPAAAARGEWLIYSDGQTAGKWSVFRSTQDLNGAAVPAASTANVGNMLYLSTASTLAYGALNLAGGSQYVSGALPGANMATCTTSTTGAIQLAGDFSSSAAGTAPRIGSLTGDGTNLSLVATTYARPTAGGGAGSATTWQGQDGATGGSVIARSGSDGTANETNAGDHLFYRGAINWLKFSGTTTHVDISAVAPAGTAAGRQLNLAASGATTTGAGGLGSFTAGDAAGAGAQNGGALVFRTGTAAGTGLKGALTLSLANASSQTVLHAAEVAAGRHAFGLGDTVNSAKVPTGNVLTWIPNATTAPSSIDASNGGALIYGDPAAPGLFTIYTGEVAGNAFGLAGAANGGSQSGASLGSIVVRINGTNRKIPYYT